MRHGPAALPCTTASALQCARRAHARARARRSGFARFTNTRYSTRKEDICNSYMHLTNVAIQKHAPGFDSSKVRGACVCAVCASDTRMCTCACLAKWHDHTRSWLLRYVPNFSFATRVGHEVVHPQPAAVHGVAPHSGRLQRALPQHSGACGGVQAMYMLSTHGAQAPVAPLCCHHACCAATPHAGPARSRLRPLPPRARNLVPLPPRARRTSSSARSWPSSRP